MISRPTKNMIATHSLGTIGLDRFTHTAVVSIAFVVHEPKIASTNPSYGVENTQLVHINRTYYHEMPLKHAGTAKFQLLVSGAR